jgi:aryl-alcohol dehydrogenase-like predicted oxidoreductase
VKYTRIGSFKSSVIGLGTWQFGTNHWGWGTEFGPKEILGILEAARETGINIIDTAELYGSGESERQIGYNIPSDDTYFKVASKVSPWHLSGSGVYTAGMKSLQRLQKAFIDLYQIHTPNPLIPISRTMAGMKRLLEEKRVVEIGVSNFSSKRWREAIDALGYKVVSNQVDYSLLRPSVYEAMRPMLTDGCVMIAYSPLAMGLLSGKYNDENKPLGGRAGHHEFSNRNYKNVLRVIEVAERIAKTHSASLSQIALAWIIGHPNVIAIPGAKSPTQVRENASAADIELSKSEMSDLDIVSSEYRAAIHIPHVFESFKWMFSRN